MFKKITRYIKLVPLLLLGVAVIVWTSIFQRNPEKKDFQKPQSGEEPPVFPY